MNRLALRFRILFEYYDDLHSPPGKYADTPFQRAHKMGVPAHETTSAMIWLIGSRLVSGKVVPNDRSRVPVIYGINNRGMDLVESVMNDTFTQIKGEFTDIDQLSTIDRMKTFAKKCLKSTTAEILCQVTLDAITKYAADL